MAIYSRKNLLISAQGPNVLLTTPVATGNVLVWDALQGSFVNQPGSELFTASNLGTGVPVFAEKDGSDFEFNTLVAGPNVTINKVGNNINISANVAGAGTVLVVADNASRDALIPSLSAGSLVFVQDDGRGNHEYAMYIWNGIEFKLVSTQDSSNVDAHSLVYTITPSSPTEIVLGNVSPGSRVVDVSVSIITPFDGTNPTVSIGDDVHGNSVHMATDASDLASPAKSQYQTESNFVYGGTQEADIKAYFNSGASINGAAQIIVSYV